MATYHESAGKGDWKRPRQVDKETYERNWDAIFGKRKAEGVCKVCHGERGSFDAGHWYECPACEEKE